MSAQSGFTLIEALATGAISSFVGMALLTVLYMSNGQIQDGSANLKITQLQVLTSEQMYRSARLAYGVRQSSEAATVMASAFGFVKQDSVKNVLFCNPAGTALTGYQIAQDTLKEWSAAGGGSWQPFKIGKDTVFVDFDNSYFDILANRHGVAIRIVSQRTVGGKTYTLPRITETARCRNTSL